MADNYKAPPSPTKQKVEESQTLNPAAAKPGRFKVLATLVKAARRFQGIENCRCCLSRKVWALLQRNEFDNESAAQNR